MCYESLKNNNIFDPKNEVWPEFECLWSSPPSTMDIVCKEIHVWRISLDKPLKPLKKLVQVLDNDEIIRADRFQFGVDRRRYIISHWALRKILGGYNDSGCTLSY